MLLPTIVSAITTLPDSRSLSVPAILNGALASVLVHTRVWFQVPARPGRIAFVFWALSRFFQMELLIPRDNDGTGSFPAAL